MYIELTPQEVEAVEKWQKYHNEINKGEFYTYQYNGAKLQSADPVEASHLRDLIKGNTLTDDKDSVIQELKEQIVKMAEDIHDVVNHPDHYNTGSIEVITYLQDKLSPEAFKGFLHGNCLKYLSRYEHKNGVEDLKKCRWYLDKLITELE